MSFSASAPRLAITGATGRVARLIRPFLPGTLWCDRATELSTIEGCHAVVCLAGVTTGSEAHLRANTQVALAALDAAAAAGVPHVMLLSSAAVYGRSTGPLVAEAAPTPAAPYGAAKAEMEAAVAKWCAEHPDGPRATVLRLGNVAGADALLGNLTAQNMPSLHVWPDGSTPRRSYIGPRSLAYVFRALAPKETLPPVLNVAAPGAVEMAALLAAAGRTWSPAEAPPQAIAEVRLDTAPLQRLIPLPPTAATAQGMVTEWQEALA